MSVGFDHLQLGTPESAWVADARMANRPPLTLRPRSDLAQPAMHLLVVGAHPDDESLGAGGLIASAAALGVDVRVIVATNGDASHPGSPTHSPQQLARIRRGEVRAAVAQLAPSAEVIFSDLPDGRLAEHQNELADVIAAHLTTGTLLVTPWSADRHPDHEACARAGTDAITRVATAVVPTTAPIRHWQYPIWLWHWGHPDARDMPWATMGVLTLGPDARSAKRRAIACHLTQHEPLSDQPGDEAILPLRLLEHFTRPFETFLVASDPAALA